MVVKTYMNESFTTNSKKKLHVGETSDAGKTSFAEHIKYLLADIRKLKNPGTNAKQYE